MMAAADENLLLKAASCGAGKVLEREIEAFLAREAREEDCGAPARAVDTSDRSGRIRG
jgi:hypothetical protein